MSESTSEKPRGGLVWTEAFSVVSLVLQIVIVLILIVTLIGHPYGRGGGGGEGHFHGDHHFGPERFGGPGMPGGEERRFEGGENRFGGGPGGEGRPGHFGEGVPADPNKIADMVVDHLSSRLNLTDAEKTQIRPVIAQQVAATQKEMEDARKARDQAKEATRAKIRSLLTADQQKQFDQLPEHGDHPDPHPAS